MYSPKMDAIWKSLPEGITLEECYIEEVRRRVEEEKLREEEVLRDQIRGVVEGQSEFRRV
jgi:hypothetical protein